MVKAIGLFVTLVLALILIQNLTSILMLKFFDNSDGTTASLIERGYKGLLVAMFPIALLVSGLAIWLARTGGQKARAVLSLQGPELGMLGWVVVVVGFLVAIAILNALVFKITGFDPQQFSPSADGANGNGKSAGAVENAMAGLAGQPLLYALAVPGIALAVPLMEEFVFRGALFSRLVLSPVGPPGAVVITSALWALMHASAAPWIFVSIIFLMGLVLGILLLRFGSLWVTIACHCAWNSLTSIGIFALGQGG
jgi:membrane protease YdiL (CAAX protease family)